MLRRTLLPLANHEGTAGPDSLTGGGGADELYGYSGDDTLSGAGGDDWLEPGSGNDLVRGGSGLDALAYGPESGAPLLRGADVDLATGIAIDCWNGTDSLTGIEWVFGSALGDRLSGNAPGNVLDGGVGNDTLLGQGGDDWLQPGPGDDRILGGTGVDVLSYDDTGNGTPLQRGALVDLARGSATDPWNGTDTLAGIENVVGSPRADTLRGAGADDLVDGRAGSDRLVNAGVVYSADPAGVFVNFSAIAQTLGPRTVAARRALDGFGDTDVLGAGAVSGYGTPFDDVWFGGDANAYAILRAGDDYVRMESGADWLMPGSGDDTLDGGSGFDGVSYLDDGFDEAGPAFQGVFVDLEAGIAIDGWNGADHLSDIEDVFGSALDDELVGNEDWNFLDGGDGNDTLRGAEGSDYFLGGGGNDTVYGGPGEDFFALSGASLADYRFSQNGDGSVTVTDLQAGDGDDGSDRLYGVELFGLAVSGGAGDDTISSDGADPILALGAGGDDRYVLRFASDRVQERPAQGIDTVQADISRALEPNVENLVLTGLSAIDGTGNNADNTMDGNGADNVLDGAEGADTLRGGDGNDTYHVDDAGDVVIEAAAASAARTHPGPGAGGTNIDTIISTVSYTLRANIENLELQGGDDLVGTGNELDNLLTGNAGDNLLRGFDGQDIIDGAGGADTLDGGAGADVLGGGAGSDTYRAGAGDQLLESANAGTDTVEAQISWTLGKNLEKLQLGGSANLDATGNAMANTLSGNAGANVLNGKAGNDTLTGGSGADTFVFDTALGGNVDQVKGFQPGVDRIRLDAAVFTQIGAALGAAEFHAGPGVTTAGDAQDRILYNSTNGALYYDADGSGGTFTPLRFATLAGAPQALAYTDFQVTG